MPLDGDVRMGPVASAEQLRDVRGGIQKLQAVGETVTGGAGQVGERGYFVAPTLLRAKTADAAVLHELEESIRIEEEGFAQLIDQSHIGFDQLRGKAPENWYIEAEEAREGAPAFGPRLPLDAEQVFCRDVVVGEFGAALGQLAAVDVAVADQGGHRLPVRIGIGPGEITGDAGYDDQQKQEPHAEILPFPRPLRGRFLGGGFLGTGGRVSPASHAFSHFAGALWRHWRVR